MGPVQGHQCPYDAPSVAEHFRKTGTVNLNPADVLLFRDSLDHYSEDEVVVSFRDVPWCHTSGQDVAEALAEAEDALEEAIAGCINHGEPIPMPSAPLPGEHMVALPIDMAAKAALALAFRASGLTQVALAKRLGVHDRVVRRMLDPWHGTSVSRINDALRALGTEAVLEVPLLPTTST